ncbi:winged helix-turn-helix domain-containing protein [Phenylobacterium sp.]|uniref:ATP-binding protein n=1 Tax=Phenylobacterium sp. TaxID=1871053 RepID=UPI001217AE45|nr:winged helix-turn-helix domain-containing protein [Phenylobacterium sp.]THD63866.1 MAG: hypothetical protein E8A49_04085 [Phenylobacterium sp.]
MNGNAGSPVRETTASTGAGDVASYEAPGATPTPASSSYVRFGPFRLQNHGEALFRGEDVVRLGSRARQILILLMARAGQVVSRAEIMAAVWPDTTVVDNNLTVNIAALRQALGDGQGGAQYIVNIPGRGYRFVAPIVDDQTTATSPLPLAVVATPTNLPVRLGSVIGLSRSLEAVIAKLRQSRLVTITGPAGVGKTTLALHVAQSEQARHPDGVWLVDLAAVRDAEHVPAAVAATMRMELGAGDHVQALVAALRRANSLLLLDNCEHLIDAVADFAAVVVRQCPDVVLLGTSREPLRISGEAIYRLAPLDAPADAPNLSAADALTYPAVQLLVERASAATNGFVLGDENASLAGAICRQLDGLPLAIEFASALVGVFGIPGLASRLDTRLRLIQPDMRGASERHRTLTAALDWSYGLLEEGEQAALRRLSAFAGGFTLEAAGSVIGLQDLGEAGGVLARLHAKSLVANDITPTDLRFRLLETTRAYAAEKLEAVDDAHEIRRRHAAYHVDLLERQGVDLRASGASRLLVDDVRRALNWGLSPQGDQRLACQLIVASAPLWFDLQLVSEFHAWTQRAVEAAARIEPPDPRLASRLANILALADFENGLTGVTRAALDQALILAEGVGDATQELTALLGLYQNQTGNLECEVGAAYALRIRSAAERANHPAPDVLQTSHHGYSLFFLDQSPEAKQIADSLLAGPGRTLGAAPTVPFEINVHISSLTNRARAHWVCGYPDQARADMVAALDAAEELKHLPSLYLAVTSGGPVPLWLRDIPLARRIIALTKCYAETLQVEHWAVWERSMEAALAPLLDEAPPPVSDFAQREMDFFPFARAMACTTHESHFAPWIDERTDRGDPAWYRAEVFRLRGLRHFQQFGATGAAEAERLIRDAFDLARARGGRSWALRAAMSLCEVLEAGGRASEGRDVLRQTYASFTEGFETFDLRRARAQLAKP